MLRNRLMCKKRSIGSGKKSKKKHRFDATYPKRRTHNRSSVDQKYIKYFWVIDKKYSAPE